MIEIAAAFGIGVALGAITGMPLGVINVAIVDAVIAREHRRARGLGIGGALADATHALLAFVGLAHVVTARPSLERVLAIVAAVVIIAHAVVAWRRRRGPGNGVGPDVGIVRPADSSEMGSDPISGLSSPRTAAKMGSDPMSGLSSPRTADAVERGVASGIALTLPNPAALGAWVAVAAVMWPSASLAIGVALAVGVGVGSAAWFGLLARLVARVSPGHRALKVVPRVALIVFVVVALVGVARQL